MHFRTVAWKFFTALGFIFLADQTVFGEDAGDKQPVTARKEIINISLAKNQFSVGDTEPLTYDYSYRYTPTGEYKEWFPLTKAAEGVEREYHIDTFDQSSDGVPCVKNEEKFFQFIRHLLQAGDAISDSYTDYHANRQSLISLFKTLIGHGVMTADDVKSAAKIYADQGMVVNLFMLDEASPGLLSAKEWSELSKKWGWNILVQTLISIKQAEYTKEAAESQAVLNGRLQELVRLAQTKAVDSQGTEQDVLLLAEGLISFGELARKGLELPEAVQQNLLARYIKTRPYDFGRTVGDTYGSLNLPSPTQSLFTKTLREEIASDPRLVIEAVSQFREGKISYRLDEGTAAIFLKIILEVADRLENIEYLVAVAGEDADGRLWQEYGDRMWWWYSAKENRELQRQGEHFEPEEGPEGGETRQPVTDSTDYFHVAVTAYRHAKNYSSTHPEAKIKFKKSLFKKMIDEGAADPLVHVADLATAYELAGFDLRSPSLIDQLELKVEAADQIKSGAHLNGNGLPAWEKDIVGNKLVPFRDAIELAAIAEDPVGTRLLAAQIRDHFLSVMENEGVAMLEASRRLEPEQSAILDSPAFQRKLDNTANSLAEAELEEIFKVYQAANFKSGARLLAYYLFESGWCWPARRFFYLAGVGEEFEKKVFSGQPESYWKELAVRFVKTYRLKGIKNNLQKDENPR